MNFETDDEDDDNDQDDKKDDKDNKDQNDEKDVSLGYNISKLELCKLCPLDNQVNKFI